MAFIIAAGVRFAYKGVQSGIQAHKDFKSDQPPEVPVDRWGQPKDRNPVYGLVMKAEERFNGGGKGKGRDVGPAGGSSSASSSGGGQQREMNKEELESQGGEGSRTYRSYGPTEPAPPPPTYEAAIAEPIQKSAGESAAEGTVIPPTNGLDSSIPSKAKPSKPHRQISSSSSLSSVSSDSDSDSDSEPESDAGPDSASRPIITSNPSTSTSPTSRRAQKLQRRVARAQKRLDRASARAERNQARGKERDSDIRKVRKAEWKLESAERKLGRAGYSA